MAQARLPDAWRLDAGGAALTIANRLGGLSPDLRPATPDAGHVGGGERGLEPAAADGGTDPGMGRPTPRQDRALAEPALGSGGRSTGGELVRDQPGVVAGEPGPARGRLPDSTARAAPPGRRGSSAALLDPAGGRDGADPAAEAGG